MESEIWLKLYNPKLFGTKSRITYTDTSASQLIRSPGQNILRLSEAASLNWKRWPVFLFPDPQGRILPLITGHWPIKKTFLFSCSFLLKHLTLGTIWVKLGFIDWKTMKMFNIVSVITLFFKYAHADLVISKPFLEVFYVNYTRVIIIDRDFTFSSLVVQRN